MLMPVHGPAWHAAGLRLMCHLMSIESPGRGESPRMLQVRRRDMESKDVMIEERRYDKAGPESAPASSQSAYDGSGASSSAADSLDLGGADDMGTPSLLPLQTVGGGFGNSFADDDASDNPYAWAQRLREIPDKVRGLHVLSLVSMMRTRPSWHDDLRAHTAFLCVRTPCKS